MNVIITREEIERAAKEEIKRNTYKLSRMQILYYLSGYFKNNQLILTDVLRVIENLQKDNLIIF